MKIKVFGTPNAWIPDTEESSYTDADMVVLPGGGDWNPTLYGQEEGIKTFWNDSVDRRDFKLIDDAIKDRKLVLGICRGAQGLTIANGGTLIQHVIHPGYHKVIIEGVAPSVNTMTNSHHHQMCNPYNLKDEDYELIGWTKGLSTTYIGDGDVEIDTNTLKKDEEGFVKEPEILYFPKTRCLALQYHPEWMDRNNDYSFMFEYSINLIHKYARMGKL